MRRLLATVCLLLLTATFMYAQEVLRGTVKEDLTGDPIPGVTVFEKGSSNGTITDAEGHLGLQVCGFFHD
jgi:CarboxypepD_reg-like domain